MFSSRHYKPMMNNMCCQVAFIFAMLFYASLGVPSLERVVYPKLLEERGVSGEKILHVDDGLVLTLEKSTVLAQDFILIRDNGREQRRTLISGRELEKDLYHDRQHMSALSIKEANGHLEVRGVLTNELKIEPSPLNERSSDGSLAHKVSKIEKAENYENDYIVPSDSVLVERSLNTTEVTPHNSEQVFVEVMVLCDHHHHQYFKKQKDLVLYMALSFIAVNLRYEVLRNPKVQFRLASVILGKNDSYVVTQTFPDPMSYDGKTVTYLLADRSIEKLGKLVQTKELEVEADLLLFVTALDMAFYTNGGLNRKVHGLAYNKALCTGYRVAEVEDTAGSFKLIDIATHELGHSCGCAHDGDRSNHNQCDPRAGFVMSPVGHGAQNSLFSECSKKEIRHYMETLSPACISVKSNVNHLKDVTDLPGSGRSASVFCKKLYPKAEYTVQDTGNYPDCKVYCIDPATNSWVYESLLDGMECAHGMICLRGKCVPPPSHMKTEK